jgi:5-methyltetrahydrofolate--homocysteine methyltransferase
MSIILNKMSDAVRDGDDKQTVELVKKALEEAVPSVDILNRGLVPGIQALSSLFKDGQAYLPEILISVRAMNRGLESLQTELGNVDFIKRGTVVLGTVEGDIHDIGKNLVGMMLTSNGFHVVDIGVDVSADTFVNAIRENNADIVAMSALLTTTMPSFITVIKALKESALRGNIKVMIGGASVSQDYADEIGADGFAPDCVTAVDEAARLMKH